MILSIGNPFYAENSKKVLSHYFNKHSIEYYFIEHIPSNIDTRGSHPSWFKLLAHKILPNYDFIICWDLDLLPSNPDVEIIKAFNMNRLCLAWDSHAKYFPNDKYCPSFKYNGGLIGIPKTYSNFTETIFDKYAPGYKPSYEQYYLNDEIESQNIDVFELPENMNVLYSATGFENAILQHYTYTHDAKNKIENHVTSYFTK